MVVKYAIEQPLVRNSCQLQLILGSFLGTNLGQFRSAMARGVSFGFPSVEGDEIPSCLSSAAAMAASMAAVTLAAAV